MRKPMSVLLCTILLLISITGCLAPDKKLYPVYLLPESKGPYAFKDETPSESQLSHVGTVEEPSIPNQVREILYDGQLHEIHLLQQSSKSDWNAYKSEDQRISCCFDSISDQLRKISVEGWLSPDDTTRMDEDDYIAWIQQQVSDYYTEDWSQYTVSCATEILNSPGSQDATKTQSGYIYPEEDGKSIVAYKFTFTKYLGDYATTDAIQSRICPDTGFVSLEFCAHEFDDTEPVKLDIELINASVYKFVGDYHTSTDYTYLMHSTSNPLLGYVKGHLSYICTINIALQALDDGYQFENTNAYQKVAVILD